MHVVSSPPEYARTIFPADMLLLLLLIRAHTRLTTLIGRRTSSASAATSTGDEDAFYQSQTRVLQQKECTRNAGFVRRTYLSRVTGKEIHMITKPLEGGRSKTE